VGGEREREGKEPGTSTQLIALSLQEWRVVKLVYTTTRI
jgi:hypothetical protein